MFGVVSWIRVAAVAASMALPPVPHRRHHRHHRHHRRLRRLRCLDTRAVPRRLPPSCVTSSAVWSLRS